MNGIDLMGIHIDKSTQLTILGIFVFYSVITIALSVWVKYANRADKADKFSSFLTGSGELKIIEVALIAAMGAMAGGTMVSAPGLTYKVGFIYSLVCFTLFIFMYVTLGTYGKKLAIIKQRINAQTTIQMLHHRYQSRGVAVTLTLITVVFLIID